LVFALAGYLVHEVYDTVPVMLLDSLEAIDADRIAALVDHVTAHADYLVVAFLPEDGPPSTRITSASPRFNSRHNRAMRYRRRSWIA
jgi:hypothetical protein